MYYIRRVKDNRLMIGAPVIVIKTEALAKKLLAKANRERPNDEFYIDYIR